MPYSRDHMQKHECDTEVHENNVNWSEALGKIHRARAGNGENEDAGIEKKTTRVGQPALPSRHAMWKPRCAARDA